MAVNITVPELGESVIEATVSHWHKKPGDPVAAGEAVVELETEKVNLEVGAAKAGVLGRIDKPEGQDVRIGDVLGVIEESAAARRQRSPPNPAAAEGHPAADLLRAEAPPTAGLSCKRGAGDRKRRPRRRSEQRRRRPRNPRWLAAWPTNRAWTWPRWPPPAPAGA